MGPKPASKRGSNAPVQRSRTGCQTCRTRKLKCDEQRPICGQCAKSHRECVRSEGITFRHQQNASLPSTTNQDELEHFFKDRKEFTDEQKQNFVKFPKDHNFQFVYVKDPYDEDRNGVDKDVQTQLNSGTPQQVAAHSLEALSTAAADHPPYLPPNSPATTYADFNSVYAPHGTLPNAYGPGHSNSTHASSRQQNDLGFLLNPSNTPSSMIDPNLEASMIHDHEGGRPASKGEVVSTALDGRESHEESGLSDSKVAYVLRNFADSSGS